VVLGGGEAASEEIQRDPHPKNPKGFFDLPQGGDGNQEGEMKDKDHDAQDTG
jgi:hypothetical protein